MDRITINGLRVKGRVGVTQEERARAQTLIVNIEIDLDLTAAAESDNLKDTIDYGEITVEAASVIRDSENKLLEPLAATIADRISTNKLVQGVTVEILKEAPPIPEATGPVGVRISR
jgi:7,8-dihydroneopterin aldolase/epimerase/oxygenase